MSERGRAVDEPPRRWRPEPPAAGLRAAVDRDVVAGDVARHVGSEEQRDAGLVLRPAEAPDRRPRLPHVVVLADGPVVDLRCLREVGPDAVDADAVAALLR